MEMLPPQDVGAADAPTHGPEEERGSKSNRELQRWREGERESEEDGETGRGRWRGREGQGGDTKIDTCHKHVTFTAKNVYIPQIPKRQDSNTSMREIAQ